MIEFVFMLTKDDRTVDDALDVVNGLRGSGLAYVGFKDVGATPQRQRELTDAAHRLGLEVMLEVVSTSAEDEAASLKAARAAGVDWVLGGTHADRGVEALAGTNIKYCPFPGTVVGHPSELRGSVADIADDARRLSGTEGVHGVDLLSYRHREAPADVLTDAVVKACSGPVIAAGSVSRVEEISTLRDAGAWGFTIGSAIFEGRLPGAPEVKPQVMAVLKMASR